MNIRNAQCLMVEPPASAVSAAIGAPVRRLAQITVTGFTFESLGRPDSARLRRTVQPGPASAEASEVPNGIRE